MSHSGASGDANPVATSDQWRMRKDMENAPIGRKLLLINPGGVLVFGTLTNETRNHFLEWAYLPKRAV